MRAMWFFSVKCLVVNELSVSVGVCVKVRLHSCILSGLRVCSLFGSVGLLFVVGLVGESAFEFSSLHHRLDESLANIAGCAVQ